MAPVIVLLLVACSERFEVEDTAGDTPGPGHDSAGRDDTAPVDTDTIPVDTDTVPELPLELCINEFMPDNNASVQDETGAYSDWIELHNPGAEALTLDGWSITDFRLEPDRHVFAGGLALPAGGFLVLWADGDPSLGVDHLSFKLAGDGGEVAVYAPDGRGSIVTYTEMAPDFSLARVPDCCEGEGCLAFDFRGTPGATNVDAVYEDVAVLPVGSTWRYWDQGTNPGAGWEAVDFDDSTWASGAGPLGYGDTHQVTTVGYGVDSANKYVTTWFRLTFEDPGVELATLTFSLLRDDGALVYLNGAEVVRDNLPDGVLSDTTLASASVGDADETAYWDYTLDPTLLTAGTNTVAVEVHQASLTSSDLGFDLAVSGTRLVTE